MKQTTLIYLFNDKKEIALCMKKRGFGQGKYNGPGGKAQVGESIQECVLRELEEETGAVLNEADLKYRGLIYFYFDEKPEWNEETWIFTANYTGALQETEEMKPYWFDIGNIPYESMRDSDKLWLPEIIDGDKILKYNVFFDRDMKFRNIENLD